MTLPRLRQAVLAAVDLDKTCEQLETELGISAPFHDPGIIHFGLRNAVYAIGDTFLEVVSPVQDGTAAGRQIDFDALVAFSRQAIKAAPGQKTIQGACWR